LQGQVTRSNRSTIGLPPSGPKQSLKHRGESGFAALIQYQHSRAIWLEFFCSRALRPEIESKNRMSFYDRDPTVPFWRSNVDVDSLFAAHAHRPDRAQSWLKYREIPEHVEAVMMRGHFEGGILGSHTYHWTFRPTHTGELAIVFPVYEQHRLVDLLAISRHNPRVWGCVTGAGQYVGSFADPNREDRTTPIVLAIHKTPYNWLLANYEARPTS
jgi:hypothetical protein